MPTNRQGNRQQKGFSLIELLIVIAIILIIVTVALPKLNKARMYAQETAALKAVQTLNTAQVQYNSTFGRFAQSLTELGPPTSGNSNASAADLISGDMAAGEKQGYRYTLTGTPTGYTISAVPVSFNATGSRTFYSDQSLVIRQNYGQEPATANSPEVGSAAAKTSSSDAK
jgi:type IV pilus assembly protein PilA